MAPPISSPTTSPSAHCHTTRPRSASTATATPPTRLSSTTGAIRASSEVLWARRPRSDLRVAAPAGLDAAAVSLSEPAELLEDLLAVGHAAGHAIERLAREQQRGLRHQDRRLAPRVVDALHEAVIDGPRRRHDLRWRHAGDGDPVPVDLGGQPLSEAFE